MNRIFLDFEELSLVLQDQDPQLVQLALRLTYLRGKIESYQDQAGNTCMGHTYKKYRDIRKEIDQLTDKFRDDYLRLG